LKSIDLRCVCGSAITLRDDSESPIDPAGRPDKQGRVFLIEVRSDEWQTRHQPCIDARVKTQKEPTKKAKSADIKS